MTNYERYFGSPDAVARFVYDGCCYDCYECLMPENAPCQGWKLHTDEIEQAVRKWLDEEAEE